MRRLHTAVALLVLGFLGGCDPSGGDAYAGWDTYEHTDGVFSVRYLSPPWTACSGTEYEDDCRECPGHIIGTGICGGSNRWTVLWIPPSLLDPEYLLIPPYKLEVSWFAANDRTPLALAEREQTRIEGAGLEIVDEAQETSLRNEPDAADLSYRGPVHLIVDDTALNRPDWRDYRVVYVVNGTRAFRVAIDTAIDIRFPEVGDMLDSFTVGDPS